MKKLEHPELVGTWCLFPSLLREHCRRSGSLGWKRKSPTLVSSPAPRISLCPLPEQQPASSGRVPSGVVTGRRTMGHNGVTQPPPPAAHCAGLKGSALQMPGGYRLPGLLLASSPSSPSCPPAPPLPLPSELLQITALAPDFTDGGWGVSVCSKTEQEVGAWRSLPLLRVHGPGTE